MLRATLGRIDGRPFAAYRDLVGSYRLDEMVLHVDRVQPDPSAPPSRLRVTLPVAEAGFADVAAGERLPLLDFLLRAFADKAAGVEDLRLPPIGPEILERSALVWQGDELELRFGVDLPAEGHRALGRQAMALMLRVIPETILGSLRRQALDGRKLRAHLETYADDRRLREILQERGWVAFVADGAVLPRVRGRSETPLPTARAVAFSAPDTLAETVELPNAGPVRGMAVPQGVTVIVGGGYHGKSTLLLALAAGVYPHVPGDGRERVATIADACAVRVDEGRPVTGVDVDSFVQGAPGVPAGPFTSASASGSTSQAAGIAEALEMGCRCLLIDEDTSAANFMARDARMQALVPPAEEPIVPLVDRLRELAADGVSAVVVAGGHGAFLAVADRVVRMDAFRAEDASRRAEEVVARIPDGRVAEADQPWRAPKARVPLSEAFLEGARVRPRGLTAIGWDDDTVDLSALPQLVDEGQTRAIADLLQLIGARYVDGKRSVAAAIAEAFAEIDRAGLAVISPWRGQTPGDYARPRPFEVAAAMDRLPGLAIAGARAQEARPKAERPAAVRRASLGDGRRVQTGDPRRGPGEGGDRQSAHEAREGRLANSTGPDYSGGGDRRFGGGRPAGARPGFGAEGRERRYGAGRGGPAGGDGAGRGPSERRGPAGPRFAGEGRERRFGAGRASDGGAGAGAGGERRFSGGPAGGDGTGRGPSERRAPAGPRFAGEGRDRRFTSANGPDKRPGAGARPGSAGPRFAPGTSRASAEGAGRGPGAGAGRGAAGPRFAGEGREGRFGAGRASDGGAGAGAGRERRFSGGPAGGDGAGRGTGTGAGGERRFSGGPASGDAAGRGPVREPRLPGSEASTGGARAVRRPAGAAGGGPAARGKAGAGPAGQGTGARPAGGGGKPDPRRGAADGKRASAGSGRAAKPAAGSAAGKPLARAAGSDGPVKKPTQSARGRETPDPQA